MLIFELAGILFNSVTVLALKYRTRMSESVKLSPYLGFSYNFGKRCLRVSLPIAFAKAAVHEEIDASAQCCFSESFTPKIYWQNDTSSSGHKVPLKMR